MNCNGTVTGADVDCLVAAISGDCPPNPAQYQCDPCPCLNGDLNGDGIVDWGDIEPFAGLNMGSTGARRVYEWDAENRLVSVGPTPGQEVTGNLKVEFVYDYLGRRVAKRVYTYVYGQWALSRHRKFIWSGWLMLQELDGSLGDIVLRQYTWGLDLAGQGGSVNSLEAAAGIGGLLAVYDTQGTAGMPDDHSYVYFYDGNGNVGQVVEWSPDVSGGAGALGTAWGDARRAARYEYDPYGRTVGPDTSGDGKFNESQDNPGPYAATNPLRFSTKYFDTETRLGYWGYRYYSPTLGRWVSRDPIGERGGWHLSAYAGNEPTTGADALGLVRWVVTVQAGSIPKSIAANFSVWESCSKCQAILWIQLVRERWQRYYWFPRQSEWRLDVLDKTRGPWYPYQTQWQQGTGDKCETVSQMWDDPGPSDWHASLHYMEVMQEFESCALCRCCNSVCVLGCINWGHHYRYNPGYTTKWGHVPASEYHRIWGHEASAEAPSDRMARMLRATFAAWALKRGLGC